MQLPHLNIHSTSASIGMRSHRPSVQIQQPSADMSIRQNGAEISINRRPSKLLIDQSAAFADADIKGIFRRNSEMVAKAKQQLQQYVAKVINQGDQMMRIENPGERFADIAKQNTDKPYRSANIGFIPSAMSNVKFDYDPGDLSFNVKVNEPNINVNINKPIISFPKWQTDVYMNQKNSISFEAVGVNVNRQL